MSVAFVDIGDPPSFIHDDDNNGRCEDNEDNVEGGDDNDDSGSGSGSGSDFGSEWELEQADNDNNKDKEDKGEDGNDDTDNTGSSNMARGGVWKMCEEPRPLLCVLDVLSLSG